MEISFQHTNPSVSHDSTLLTVSPRDGDDLRYLIDAGESVSPGAFIGPDASLDGVFLTHAHSDHYRSLGPTLSGSPRTPLYTSPATASILEQVVTEANQYQDLGDVDAVSEALTPIGTWTTLADGVYVLPVSAGHTPGAAAFLFRVDDLEQNDETVTVLATGDFTTRSAAGYPGLTVPDSIDIDILIANAATTEDFPGTLSESIEILLERALSGAATLVATSALTGVHLAYVLGHLVDDLERQLPIHLVGQAAKHYTSLEYDVPSVTAYPEFEHTDEVLDRGGVTIAGPESPTQGSMNRLFGVVETDPDAVFIQLTTSSPEIVSGAACATHNFELSNHVSEQQFLDFVAEHLPRHLVFKHVDTETAKGLASSLENLFHWENDDMNSHVLYDDGDWVAPHWVSESGASLIRRRNYRESGMRIPIDRPVEKLPSASWDRQSTALQSEGVAVDKLTEQFKSTQLRQTIPQEAATSDGGQASPQVSNVDAGSHDSVDESDPSSDDEQSQVESEFQSEIVERLETIESSLDDLIADQSVEETLESGVETVEDRLTDVETSLEDLPEKLARDEPEKVTGTVIQQNDLMLFRVDSADLESLDQIYTHNDKVELSLHKSGSVEDPT